VLTIKLEERTSLKTTSRVTTFFPTNIFKNQVS